MTLQLIHRHVPVRQGLVVDPLARHYRRMRQAIWLYLYLLLAVNRSTGKRLLSPARVARDMGISEATVRSWLGHLRKHGYVTAERQGDLVSVSVTKWRLPSAPSEIPAERPEMAPVRSGPFASPETLASALGCAPDEPFLVEALSREDPDRLREVLDRVERVPDAQIKKSRLALFRYLLKTSKGS